MELLQEQVFEYCDFRKADLTDLLLNNTTFYKYNEVWVISAVGLCYEANPILILGDELRYLLEKVKNLRST